MENFDIDTNNLDHNAKTTNLSLKRKIKSNHLEKWVNKKQHGYLKHSRKSMQDIDNQNTEIWLKNAPVSSHTEEFIFAIHEEEVYMNHLAAKRDKKKTTNLQNVDFTRQKTRLSTILLLGVQN